MKKETKVNCEVENCKHNEEKYCCLDELDITCTCDNDACEEKEETICNNFEKEETDDDCEELEYEEEVEYEEVEYDDAEGDYTDDEDDQMPSNEETEDDEEKEELIEDYIEIEDE